MNIIGVLNKLSYGNVCTGFVHGLSQNNYPVSLFPIHHQDIDSIYYQSVKQALANAQYYDVNSPCIRVWHQFEMTQFVGKRRIGFPIFELNKFNPLELHHLKACDELIVCSKWAQNILQDHNLQSKVCPLGVNTSVFQPKHLPGEKTIFLVGGKLEIRKGHDIVTKLFERAFSENDNVELWLWINNPFLKDDDFSSWKKFFLTNKLASKIRFVPYLNTIQDVAELYNSVTAGICISRAEGWNLPLLELMACGRKNIVTNYSGHTEYCNNDNSYLINIDTLETAYDGYWFKSGIGEWAKIGPSQEDQIIEAMRTIHRSNREFNRHCVTTGLNYDWKLSGKKLYELCCS